MQDNLLNPENVATDPRSKKTNIMRKTGHWKADFESELQEEIAKVDPINICWRIRKKIAEKLRAEKYPDSPQLKKLKFSKESFQTKRTQDIEPYSIRVFVHLQKATVSVCLQESGAVSFEKSSKDLFTKICSRSKNTRSQQKMETFRVFNRRRCITDMYSSICISTDPKRNGNRRIRTRERKESY